MARVGAEYYVEVHGITAGREVLGQQLTITRGDVLYRIDLPMGPDSFSFSHIGPSRVAHDTPDPRDYEPTTALVQSGDLVDIRLIRIVANAESTLSAGSYDHANGSDPSEFHRLFYDLWYGVLQLARDFCLWIGIRLDQYWIEPGGEYPRIVNAVELIDLEAQKSFGHVIGTARGFLRIVAENTILHVDALRDIGSYLEDPGTPGTDEILLSEAWHLISNLPRWHTAPERATLLGAIALELCIKRVVRILLFPKGTARKGRRGYKSPHDLYLEIVRRNRVGSIDRVLDRRVQQLFNARDRIVHDGATLDHTSASLHVGTAREAFSLLRQIESDRAALLTSVVALLSGLSRKRIAELASESS